MIILAEPQCFGIDHCEVNAAFIAYTCEYFPDQPVLFISNGSHSAEVARILQENNCTFTNLTFAKHQQTKAANVLKQLSQLIAFTLEVIKVSRQKRPTIVLFLSTTASVLLTIKLLSSLYSPCCSVAFILHGVLEGAFRRPRRPIFYALCLPSFLQQNYIVLGHSIYRNLTAQSPMISRNVTAISMPYLYRPTPQDHSKPSAKIRLGHIGVASFAKGSAHFATLAEVSYERRLEYLEYVLCGPIRDKALFTGCAAYRIVSNARGFVDGRTFNSTVDSLDAVVFFYPQTMYRYTASAAIHAALRAGKPVLATKNDYFSQLFSEIGEIGKLFDSPHDLIDYITSNDEAVLRHDLRVAKLQVTKSQPVLVSMLRETAGHLFYKLQAGP